MDESKEIIALFGSSVALAVDARGLALHLLALLWSELEFPHTILRAWTAQQQCTYISSCDAKSSKK